MPVWTCCMAATDVDSGEAADLLRRLERVHPEAEPGAQGETAFVAYDHRLVGAARVAGLVVETPGQSPSPESR
jgi:hypothetical protein